ncbi:MAG: hypothetical protein LBN39_12145 [Planctomycetaceae bacterium]|jgi:hypothetical protein|nr:hypothetical protein [Planctomycetaceae bacterium]
MFRQIFILALLFTSACRYVQADPVPFDYPDPRTVGTAPYLIQGKAPVVVNRHQHPDRYAGVSEAEIQRRLYEEQCQCDEIEGFSEAKDRKCPLCENDPATPCIVKRCGKCEGCKNNRPCEKWCKMCQTGFPCEKTLCRHCVQPRGMNMGNNCDLTAGDEPCGTCDACREHRSDPCEHADDGWDIHGQFNPYKEPRLLSRIPRPILDEWNNGARKFPVYYNPAPYYRPHWNPSLFTGYARPYTFRWSCPLCHKDPCDCANPGYAGQVPYAYTCKLCNRNPCACAQDICNVNKAVNPKGVSAELARMNEESTAVNKREDRDNRKEEEEKTREEEKPQGLLNDEEPPVVEQQQTLSPN